MSLSIMARIRCHCLRYEDVEIQLEPISVQGEAHSRWDGETAYFSEEAISFPFIHLPIGWSKDRKQNRYLCPDHVVP